MLFIAIYLLVSWFNFTNASLIDLTNSTNMTIKAPILTSESTTAISPTHLNAKYLDSILEQLNAEKASKCEYGNDPKISELCPELFARETDYNDLRLNDIERIVINKTILELLKHKCLNNRWCLNDADIKPFNLALAHSSLQLCLYAACHSTMSAYIQKCVKSEISRGVLNIAPTLCELTTNGKSKQLCLESSMRLIHSTIPSDYNFNSNKTLVNKCDENISKGTCQNECKTFALEINKLDSCCQNTTLILSFDYLKWFSLYSENVEKKCNLPLTGVCFSEKFIGISVNILAISVIITAMTMLLIFLTIFAVCCKKPIKVQSFIDNYEYAQLNQEVEEEMNMERVCLSEDEYGNMVKHNRINLNDNTNISRFVNQHQTDIKNLLMN